MKGGRVTVAANQEFPATTDDDPRALGTPREAYDRVLEILERAGAGSVLDCPAGQGAFAKRLLDSGYRVRAGFGRIESYWALPDARYPVMYIPFQPGSIARARNDSNLLQLDSRLTRYLLKFAPARLIPWIAPSLVFVAHMDVASANPRLLNPAQGR